MIAVLIAAAMAAPTPDDAADVLAARGCLACHTVDGTSSVGPTLAGVAGTERVVVGGPQSVTADEAYLRESVTDPDARVVSGYAPGLMPRFDQATADEVVPAILALPPAAPTGSGPPWMVILALCSSAFVGLHLFLTIPRVRDRVMARVGSTLLQVLYSVPIGLSMGGMIWSWSEAPYVQLWAPAPWTRWVPLLVMPVAFVLLLAGYTTKSPTQTGQESALSTGPVGIQTITRHPANWGIALWAAAHMFPNGDTAAALFFGGFLSLCIVGSLHIDQRRRAAHGPHWEAFAARTSFVPFVAIMQGRARLDMKGIGWRLPVGLALYLAVLFGHVHLMGASPFPS